MAGGLWLDALIVAFVITALVLLSRTRVAPGSDPSEAAPGLPRRLVEGLRSTHSSWMRQAGFDPASSRLDYWLAKLAAAGILPLLLLEALAAWGTAARGSWLMICAVAGFFLPDLWLLGRRRARRRLIARDLPHFLELIAAFLQASLSLVEAFRRAEREGFSGPHPLAQEVALVGRELDAGRDPIAAFQDLAQRTGVPELNAVATALRMGLRLGAPLRQTLQAQARALWTKRREDTMKRIHHAEVQVVFVMMLVGFPVFAVLALFPLAIELLEVVGEVFG